MSYKHGRCPPLAGCMAVAGALVASVGSLPAVAGVYSAVSVRYLQSPTPSANCLYFQLVGITQADPVSPNNPWFAVPATQNGFAQVYATLLAAKVAGQNVSVVTTGALAGGSCGNYAGVDNVMLQ